MKLKEYKEKMNDYLDKIETLTEKANLRALSSEEKTEIWCEPVSDEEYNELEKC